METPKPESKLASASEYALIFGAGASAAMSLAAQQVAAASVPVTALVAIGLMNRRRLDRQLQSGQPFGSLMEEKSAREQELSESEVTAQPLPSQPAHPLPQPSISPVPTPPAPSGNMPAMGPTPAMARPATPAMSASPQLRFSAKQQRLIAAKEALQTAQFESLQKIGAQLQEIRLDRGFSLQDIHHQTYIQRYALQAIENGDLDALPEPFYVRAFIKKYAIALGLSGVDLANQFPTA